MSVNVLAKPKPLPGLVAGPAPTPAVPTHAARLDLADRHCVVCGLPGSVLLCAGCKNPVCADRPECCEAPSARRPMCAHCEVPAVFPDW